MMIFSDMKELAAEALKERNTALKEAAERNIQHLKKLEQNFAESTSDVQPQSRPNMRNDDLLRPFLLACETRNLRLSLIAVGALHKMLSQGLFGLGTVPTITGILTSFADQNDMNVQLRVLQSIVSLITSVPGLHGDGLLPILALCIQMLALGRNSSVVATTAESTFRQLVSTVFERLLHTVRPEPGPPLPPKPPGYANHSKYADNHIKSTVLAVSVSSDEDNIVMLLRGLRSIEIDAFLLFRDLCVLSSGGDARWLSEKLPARTIHSAISSTLALDLIDNVLTNYAEVFRQIDAFKVLLTDYVTPPVVRALYPKSDISVFTRALRIVDAVCTQLSDLCPTEAETFLTLAIKSLDIAMLPQRVLALQLIRHICSVHGLLISIYKQLHGSSNDGVFSQICVAVSHYVESRYTPSMHVAVRGIGESKTYGAASTNVGGSLGLLSPQGGSNTSSDSHGSLKNVNEGFGVSLAMESLMLIAASITSAVTKEMRSLEDTRLLEQMIDKLISPLLRAFSKLLSSSNDEGLVQSSLRIMQSLVQVSGELGLVRARQSVIRVLCVHTTPPGRIGNVTEEPLTTTNLLVGETLLNITHGMGSVLGRSWIDVLACFEKLWTAVQTQSQLVPKNPSGHVSPNPGHLRGSKSGQLRPPPPSEDLSILVSGMSSLFENTAFLDLTSLKDMLVALVTLSSRSIGFEKNGANEVTTKITSTIHDGVRGMFACTRLIETAQHNVKRLATSGEMWAIVTDHLVDIAMFGEESRIRSVAVDAIAQMTRTALESLSTESDGDNSKFQYLLVVPICRVTGSPYPDSRERALHSIHSTLQACGDIVHRPGAWQVVFEALKLVSESSTSKSGGTPSWIYTPLKTSFRQSETPQSVDLAHSTSSLHVSAAFRSLQLIVSDFIQNIPARALVVCIETIGSFVKQRRDVNLSLTANALMWSVADFLAKQRDKFVNDVSDDDWTLLLKNSEAKLEEDPLVATETSRGESQQRTVASKLPGVVRRIEKLSSGPKTPGRLVRQDQHSAPAAVPAKTISKSPSLTKDSNETENIDDSHGDSHTFSALSSQAIWQKLWISTYAEMQQCVLDPRNEVRNSSIRTLITTLSTHGGLLEPDSLESVLWRILFPLLDIVTGQDSEASGFGSFGTTRASMPGHAQSGDAEDVIPIIGREGGKGIAMMVHHTRNTAAKQWDESRALAVEGFARVFKIYADSIAHHKRYPSSWMRFLKIISVIWISSHEKSNETRSASASTEVAVAAMHAFEASALEHVKLWNEWWNSYVESKTESTLEKSKLAKTLWENTFDVLARMAYCALSDPDFSEKAVLSLVSCVYSIRSKHSSVFSVENDAEILEIARLALRHPASNESGEISWQSITLGTDGNELGKGALAILFSANNIVCQKLREFSSNAEFHDCEVKPKEDQSMIPTNLPALSRVQAAIVSLIASFPPVADTLWTSVIDFLLSGVNEENKDVMTDRAFAFNVHSLGLLAQLLHSKAPKEVHTVALKKVSSSLASDIASRWTHESKMSSSFPSHLISARCFALSSYTGLDFVLMESGADVLVSIISTLESALVIPGTVYQPIDPAKPQNHEHAVEEVLVGLLVVKTVPVTVRLMLNEVVSEENFDQQDSLSIDIAAMQSTSVWNLFDRCCTILSDGVKEIRDRPIFARRCLNGLFYLVAGVGDCTLPGDEEATIIDMISMATLSVWYKVCVNILRDFVEHGSDCAWHEDIPTFLKRLRVLQLRVPSARLLLEQIPELSDIIVREGEDTFISHIHLAALYVPLCECIRVAESRSIRDALSSVLKVLRVY